MTGTKSLEHNKANRSEWSESTEHDYAWKTGNDFESEKYFFIQLNSALFQVHYHLLSSCKSGETKYVTSCLPPFESQTEETSELFLLTFLQYN